MTWSALFIQTPCWCGWKHLWHVLGRTCDIKTRDKLADSQHNKHASCSTPLRLCLRRSFVPRGCCWALCFLKVCVMAGVLMGGGSARGLAGVLPSAELLTVFSSGIIIDNRTMLLRKRSLFITEAANPSSLGKRLSDESCEMLHNYIKGPENSHGRTVKTQIYIACHGSNVSSFSPSVNNTPKLLK